MFPPICRRALRSQLVQMQFSVNGTRKENSAKTSRDQNKTSVSSLHNNGFDRMWLIILEIFHHFDYCPISFLLLCNFSETEILLFHFPNIFRKLLCPLPQKEFGTKDYFHKWIGKSELTVWCQIQFICKKFFLTYFFWGGRGHNIK